MRSIELDLPRPGFEARGVLFKLRHAGGQTASTKGWFRDGQVVAVRGEVPTHTEILRLHEVCEYLGQMTEPSLGDMQAAASAIFGVKNARDVPRRPIAALRETVRKATAPKTKRKAAS